MAAYEMYLFKLSSVTSYTGPGSLFPNSALGNTGVGGTVRFGALDGEKVVVDDNDPEFNDGDTGLLGIGGQTSSFSGSLFNLSGSSEPEYSYRLTHPVTGDTVNIYAFTSAGLFGLSNSVIGFVADGPIDPAVTYSISYAAGSPSVAYSSLTICFAAGTQILTGHGEHVAIEDLKQGDMILTVDHGPQVIRWIGSRHLTAGELVQAPSLRPIRIQAGALGGGRPVFDLIVSPQHRVLINSKIVQKMFGEKEVLVAAKQLVSIDGIDVVNEYDDVTYYHFLCDQHESVFANGVQTESLYAGPQAMKSLSKEARDEVLMILPELSDIEHKALQARPAVLGRQGRHLAFHHKRNAKYLISHSGDMPFGQVTLPPCE
ncbi:Hint domain-containing protein [Pseudotabrizicola sp. 4114]|uniref:Hint domain-containing protein n=1 Tax=Pseudotabrizicola sp. 4114 TaxID=2817731 RepID=UPI002858B726|nr:hypothetical protein [Pseudorhodobacter sp. 4114]